MQTLEALGAVVQGMLKGLFGCGERGCPQHACSTYCVCFLVGEGGAAQIVQFTNLKPVPWLTSMWLSSVSWSLDNVNHKRCRLGLSDFSPTLNDLT